MTRNRLIALFSILLWLAACSIVRSTPQPTQFMAKVVETKTDAASVVPHTSTPTRSTTPTNLSTSMPSPTAVPAETTIVRPTPSATETPTAVVSPTPSLWQSLPTPKTPFTPEIDLAIVDQIGGIVRTVTMNGNDALIGVGPRLLVLDVSDPTVPKQTGLSDIFPKVVQDVVWHGDRAYVATNERGFWLVDMRMAATPQIEGFFEVPHLVTDFKLQNETLLALDKSIPRGSRYDLPDESHLSLVDISDSENLSVLNTVEVDGRVHSWSLVDESVYLMKRGLDVVNIVDPHSPEISHIPEIYERAVAVAAENELYLVGNEKIKLVDISDPTNPFEVDPGANDVFPGYGIADFEIDGQTLFLTGNFCDAGSCASVLQIHDASKSGFPEMSSVGAGFLSYDLFVQDSYAYIATEEGLNIVDVREPASASGTGWFVATGRVNEVSVAPNRVGALNPYTHSLYFFPLKYPAQLDEPIRYAPSFDMAELLLMGDDAFLSTGIGYAPGDLRIVDVVDVRNPAVTGIYEPEEIVSGVRETIVRGEFAYTLLDDVYSTMNDVSAVNDIFAVIDISNPATPRRIGLLQIESLGMQTNLAMADETVYATMGNRLMVISVHDPEYPEVVGELDLGEDGIVSDVKAVPDGVLLIWDNGSIDEEELLLIDSSIPEHMQILNRLSIPDDLDNLAFEEPYAYISGNQLWVANVSDPKNLRLVGTSVTPGALHQVAVQNGVIYASDGTGGLLVLQIIE